MGKNILIFPSNSLLRASDNIPYIRYTNEATDAFISMVMKPSQTLAFTSTTNPNILAISGANTAVSASTLNVKNYLAFGSPAVQVIDGTSNWIGPQTGIAGSQGAKGATGTQGTAGPQGVQGVQGAQGAAGPQGAQGGVGAQGLQGDLGATGPQGAQGTQGTKGVTGQQGSQGTPGAQGVFGAQGAQGAQGTQGATGAQGPLGPQGTAGAQGVQGAQGATGITGPQGAQGAIGIQGSQGFQGVSGPQGATGAQGNLGAQGAQGTAGPQGSQGASGNAAATGAQGFQGAAGPFGAPGISGPQGFQGSQGAPGANGATGPQGAQGASGNAGGTGPQGSQGAPNFSPGPQGSQGAAGTTGFQGGTGPTGAAGPQGTQGATGPAVTCYQICLYYSTTENDICYGAPGTLCLYATLNGCTTQQYYTTNTDCVNANTGNFGYGGYYFSCSIGSSFGIASGSGYIAPFQYTCGGSDVRAKDGIETIEYALDGVMKLQAVEYDWNKNFKDYPNLLEKNKIHNIGLIAQQVRQIYPEVVSLGEDGYYQVSYSKLNAVLVEAIKEQQILIEDLDKQIQELETLIDG